MQVLLPANHGLLAISGPGKRASTGQNKGQVSHDSSQLFTGFFGHQAEDDDRCQVPALLSVV